jgi:POT family proton-dependent oligopeptide transporter
LTTPASARAPRYPTGIPYIIGNEAAERFSYYGMKTILVVFMTSYLIDRSGALATMTDGEATVWYHVFGVANYFVPLFGALISDIWWGKYRTIMVLSVVYCLGHLCLALDGTRLGLAAGLSLIALGAGGIKPCVSAHVGDQFSPATRELVPRIFGYFYLAINIGAFISSLLTPVLLERAGPHVAFAVPGVLMLIATVVFRIGRSRFIAVPPIGWQAYRRSFGSPEGKHAVANLVVIYLFVALFWSLFDQSGSTWVLQCEHMDRRITLFGLSFEVLPSQLQALNPILILAIVPFFSLVLYPFAGRFARVSAVRKIAAGLVLTGAAFLLIAAAETHLQRGEQVSVMWQVWAYVIITMAEALVSVTALEFAYTQAPQAMKSFIMSFYLLAVSLGNAFTALFNFALLDAEGRSRIAQDTYFYFFSILIWAGGGIFYILCRRYEERSYLHMRAEAATEIR